MNYNQSEPQPPHLGHNSPSGNAGINLNKVDMGRYKAMSIKMMPQARFFDIWEIIKPTAKLLPLSGKNIIKLRKGK